MKKVLVTIEIKKDGPEEDHPFELRSRRSQASVKSISPNSSVCYPGRYRAVVGILPLVRRFIGTLPKLKFLERCYWLSGSSQSCVPGGPSTPSDFAR